MTTAFWRVGRDAGSPCGVTPTELLSRGLLRDHRVLDICSGIANLAIGLRDYLRRYDGVEITERPYFTHMLPEAVEHYLHEISRLLAPSGVCVASFFLLNDETSVGVETGRSFMSFPVRHTSGLCRLHDANVPEAAIAIDEQSADGFWFKLI